MTHPGPAWLQWLEATAVAAAMREWRWLYPMVEITHIVGLAVLVGAAVFFDLRLLGVSRQLPVSGLERHLLRWARASLLLIVPSGAMMFAAHAVEFGENPAFRLKLALLAAAGLNAAVFHRFSFRVTPPWDLDAVVPVAAKASAVFSLLAWTSIIACGRLIAYF